ncbi:hypothetical protein M378DRAFT_421760 [Amanita muscaria Koide BX008]|uniref:Uncharacterized protein n=1 Tax=Amanita muscaria (strain Koide BX008) TaxID=946122 RepID=A0A0C2WLP2_AMAMK|nr:hypothetical protein M378DRAFT_421760 [Amanita muscaria Koide BX008]
MTLQRTSSSATRTLSVVVVVMGCLRKCDIVESNIFKCRYSGFKYLPVKFPGIIFLRSRDGCCWKNTGLLSCFKGGVPSGTVKAVVAEMFSSVARMSRIRQCSGLNGLLCFI